VNVAALVPFHFSRRSQTEPARVYADLIDADFQQIDLQRLGIHVVQPRLQNVPPHALFAWTGEGTGISA